MAQMTVLIAIAKGAERKLEKVLSGHGTIFVTTFTDAQVALKTTTFNAILVGLHFDDSRMFDLIRYVRGNPTLVDLPVVGCRAVILPGSKIKISEDQVDLACRELGARGFVDLTAFPDDETGNVAARKALDQLMVQ